MSTPTDPEEIPRFRGDLRERVLANDKEGTIEIYYERLCLGRPLSEIMAGPNASSMSADRRTGSRR